MRFRLTTIYFVLLLTTIISAQWTKTTITDNAGNITGFATIGSNIFASTAALTSTQTGGVYVSKDGGSSWALSNTGNTNKTVTSLTILGSSLFISTDGDGILVSKDNGATWTKSNNGLKTLKVLKVMASGTKLYAGTDGGLYVSSNNGADWSNLTSSLSNQYIKSFIATPSVIILNNQGYPMYYSSTDNGAAWKDASVGLPMGSSNCFAQFGNDILAGTMTGVYTSSDNGASWKSLYICNSAPYSIANIGGNLFSGTGTLKGISYSVDKGKTWTAKNDGIDQLSLTINAATLYGTDVIIGSTNSAIFKYSLSKLGLTDVKKLNALPNSFSLGQNYPNPFNPTTTINYSIPSTGNVRIKVYDLPGRQVADLLNETQSAGTYNISFDAKNLSSGIYIYSIQFGNNIISKKMQMLK